MKEFEKVAKRLKRELKGKEFLFWELDNFMMSEGFGSLCDTNAWDDDLIEWNNPHKGGAAYPIGDRGCDWINVVFNVIKRDNPDSPDYQDYCFTLVVTDVEVL